MSGALWARFFAGLTIGLWAGIMASAAIGEWALILVVLGWCATFWLWMDRENRR